MIVRVNLLPPYKNFLFKYLIMNWKEWEAKWCTYINMIKKKSCVILSLHILEGNTRAGGLGGGIILHTVLWLRLILQLLDFMVLY